jgi:hypothetical protein
MEETDAGCADLAETTVFLSYFKGMPDHRRARAGMFGSRVRVTFSATKIHDFLRQSRISYDRVRWLVAAVYPHRHGSILQRRIPRQLTRWREKSAHA